MTAEREQRKVVTVVFCDLAGSTALGESIDPERLRALLARYFDHMRTLVERHGGTVEKFIGDAVMAVFGVPTAHEDDALRAVRAALEMRDALPGLDLEGRLGVMTGEVVTGTGERLATGDAVNVAARLEQAAQPGEILIGEPTLALVRAAVDVEPVQPLDLKGKGAPVPAFRLVDVHEAPERPQLDTFIGRDRELILLGHAWERSRDGRHCELVTVVGEAGVGKSRLTAEFVGSIEATVVRGRCLPYGDGITYWPVVEVLKQLRLSHPGEGVTAAIRSLLGESEAPTSAEEIAWAFRKTLEHAARAEPLVVVFDDVQWGEDTFCELVEHVALLSAGAPILLLCIARPELVERRPEWPLTLRLEPLPPEAVDELIPETLGSRLRAQIATTAGGNPLFVQEMLAMAREADGDVVVPPTLRALLAARLDQLDLSERSVLERGAVEGEIFHRGAVQALAADDLQVTPRLAALVRKQLITPDRPQVPGEDGFRFRHILLRDAAYEALPKGVRSELHRRFAAWLEEHGRGIVELDELLGYHLERAYGYQCELGQADGEAVRLAERASGHLAVAGRRAVARLDTAAAINLLGRARDLPSREAWQLGLDLATALRLTGRIPEADALLRATATEAAARGDRRAELHAQLAELEFAEDAVSHRTLAEQALQAFEQADDETGLMRAWIAIGAIERSRCRFASSATAIEHALALARRTGDERVANTVTFQLVSLLVWGPTPVEEALRWIEDLGVYRDHPLIMSPRAQLEAMRGRFAQARWLQERAAARWNELVGHEHAAIWDARYRIERLAGDVVAAERAVRRACELLEESGERPYRSTLTGELARVLCALGLFAEAEDSSRLSEELGTENDVDTQMLWRQTRATALAHRGELAQARRLARAAVALAEQSDDLNANGDALVDLAHVLELSDQRPKAAAALAQARALYARKGNVVMAERVQARLSADAEASRR